MMIFNLYSIYKYFIKLTFIVKVFLKYYESKVGTYLNSFINFD